MMTEHSIEDSGLLPTESAPSVLPSHVRQFADGLIGIHGSVRVATESSGLHFYLPCPDCLRIDGVIEVDKKHLAVNVDKFFGGQARSTLCMKCGYMCDTEDLQYMPPLRERGIDHVPERIKLSSARVEYMERDEYGRQVPLGAGMVTPIVNLSDDHPVIWYLRSRHYDPEALWRQFQCCWCERENPQRRYREQPGGFKVTPQGRLILYCLQEGSRVGWQGRILDYDLGGVRYFWHPYREGWVAVLHKVGDKWFPLPGYDGWDMAKYWTGSGTRRSQVVMGLDAALAWNADRPRERRYGVVLEGPLDAGRLGPPAMAMLGKVMSAGQAELLSMHFQRLLIVRDNDVAGEKLDESASRHLSVRNCQFDMVKLPGRFKDVGMMSPLEARVFRSMLEERVSGLAI